ARADAAVGKKRALVRARDQEIAKLKGHVGGSGGEKTHPRAPAAPADTKHVLSGDVVDHLEQLSNCSEAPAAAFKLSLARERGSVRGQLAAKLADLEQKNVEIEDQIANERKDIAQLGADISALEQLRWQGAAPVPQPASGPISLKAAVPALDLPIDRLVELLKPPAAQVVPVGEAAQSNAEATPVPMDTDDAEELRQWHRDASGEPPEETDLVREAAKRYAEAADERAIRRRTA
ncbi:unnamed protein product, partial [Prorocentrum cordatum]